MRRSVPLAGLSTEFTIFSVSTSSRASPLFDVTTEFELPRGDGAFLHLDAPLGHRDRADAIRAHPCITLADGGFDLGRTRHVGALEFTGERHGGVRRRHRARRSLERMEALLRDDGADVCRNAAARIRFVHDHEAAGILDAFEDRLLVERRRRARIDQVAGDAFLRQRVDHLFGEDDHAADRDHRDVFTFAQQVRLAKRDRVRTVGHFALARVERLVLEEHHGIVVADRLDQQALGVIRRSMARTTLRPGTAVSSA